MPTAGATRSSLPIDQRRLNITSPGMFTVSHTSIRAIQAANKNLQINTSVQVCEHNNQSYVSEVFKMFASRWSRNMRRSYIQTENAVALCKI